MTSCGQDDENSQQPETKASAKNDLTARFREYAKSKLDTKNTSRIVGSVEYDFENIYYNKESNGYFLLQKGYDVNSDDEQMAVFSGMDEKGGFTGLVEMGSTKIKNGKFTVKYYDAEQVLASVDFDLSTSIGISTKIFYMVVQATWCKTTGTNVL